MNDLISRQATIDAMEGVDWYHIDSDGQLVHGANSKEDEPLYKAKDVYAVLNKLPSAQPEKRTEKHTETHACDCISRQAAIEALDVGAEVLRRVLDDADIVCAEREKYKWGLGLIESCISDINELPPAQPEIVQCEDCQHWEQETINDGYCTEMDLRMCDADFYCGYAERRTDGIR